MAVLPLSDRQAILATWMQQNTSTVGALVKADIQAAITAIDSWADSNAASFNAAIPQPARSALTAQQKADLFYRVVLRRYQVS